MGKWPQNFNEQDTLGLLPADRVINTLKKKGKRMAALLVFIVSTVFAVISYKKVSKGCRDKSRGKFRTLITALLSGSVVFIVTMGVGAAAFVSSDKDKNAKDATTVSASTAVTASEKSASAYTCNKFNSITQTQQGTKHRAGYYSDSGINITYNITAESLSQRLYVPSDNEDSIETANFNKIAEDGSRKYGNSSSNFFVLEMNDTTVKVIIVNFEANMTVTQICSKS